MRVIKDDLLKWTCERHAIGCPLDRHLLRDKALEIAREHGLTGTFPQNPRVTLKARGTNGVNLTSMKAVHFRIAIIEGIIGSCRDSSIEHFRLARGRGGRTTFGFLFSFPPEEITSSISFLSYTKLNLLN